MSLTTTLSIAAILIAIAAQRFSSLLLPYGPALPIPLDRGPHNGPRPDPTNALLRLSSGKLTKIYERVADGQQPKLVKPETIILDDEGNIYFLNEDAKLISLEDIRTSEDPHVLTAEAVEVAHLGVGRPLSAKFDHLGCLYFVDVILGLARICLDNNNNENPNPRPVELLASRVKLPDGTWSPINYADDIDIGPKSGHVYFSDATDARPDRDARTGKWDIMYPSKVEGVRWNASGRLLRYKPETGEVDVLAAGASFANGVAVDKDESFVLYVSTFDRAVMKCHLKGERAGQSEKVLDQFPGLLDGVDCSFRSGKCYVAMPGTISSSLAALFGMPSFLSVLIRSFLLMLPRNATPDAKPYGGFAEIYPGIENSPASILRVFQDLDGRDVDFVTGVTEFGGKVYLGSLHNDFVGVYDLD